MTVNYMDTRVVKEISQKIISYANEYDILINELYSKLLQIPNETKEWIGNQSEYYFKTIALDKADYIEFGQKIREFGQTLSKNADLMDETINNAKKLESKDKIYDNNLSTSNISGGGK